MDGVPIPNPNDQVVEREIYVFVSARLVLLSQDILKINAGLL